MSKGNYPPNLYFNPRFVMDRMQGLIQKHGLEKAFSNSKYKAEREAWITATYALGLTKITGQTFWVGINSEDSTPDTYLIALKEGKRGTVKEILNCEVVEWESHSKDTLADAIRRKMANKKYPDYFILLCYGHGHDGEKIDTNDIFTQFQKERFSVGEIWLLASVESPDNHYLIIKLFPDKAGVEFTQEDELEAYAHLSEMMQADRGSEPSQNLGVHYFPLPD